MLSGESLETIFLHMVFRNGSTIASTKVACVHLLDEVAGVSLGVGCCPSMKSHISNW